MTYGDTGLWIIGYGSLIFKPPPFTEFRVDGNIKGFVRRFWQSSSDHRGTVESPGRVVTLVSLQDLKENPRFHHDVHLYHKSSSRNEQIIDLETPTSELRPEDLKVCSCAYYVAPENALKVKEYLDVREQDGYTLHKVPFYITGDLPQVSEQVLKSLSKTENGDYYLESNIYIGTITNKSFVGPEDIESTARVINNSVGPSGTNAEYLFSLYNAVKELQVRNDDEHDYYLEELCNKVNEIKQASDKEKKLKVDK